MPSTMTGERMARKTLPHHTLLANPSPPFFAKGHYDGSFAKGDLRNGRGL
ncbi:hypothetical protein K6W36_01775 [Acetobacter senegalensis]|nr:hypothetical protein [Acetobacter senegalensis]MCG4259317.1 hypothetical protein [Acetobacter senegalensis]